MKCPYCSADFSYEVAMIHIPFCENKDKEPEQEQADAEKVYADMTVKELKALLDSREIEYNKNAPKEMLIETLEIADLEDEEHYE